MRGRPVAVLVFTALYVSTVILAVQQQNQSTPYPPPGAIKPTLSAPSGLPSSQVDAHKQDSTLDHWTQRQIQHCRLLRGLTPADSQEQLAGLLDHVGRVCERMFQDYPQVTCDELVNSEVLQRVVARSGLPYWRPYSKVHRKFRYMVLPRSIGNVPAFQEYRTDLKGNPLDAATTKDFPVITVNFASSFLCLSSADQHENRYRFFGVQKMRGNDCYVVGFVQEPGKVHRASVVYSQGKGHVVPIQGLTWIDTQTLQILRVATWLLTPQTNIGLDAQTSTVDFYPTRLSGAEKTLWVPQSVKVETILRETKVINTHHYMNFELFRVESTIKPVDN